MFSHIQPKKCIIAVFSSIFLAFGLYHVHSCSGITEGGILGLTLLLEHLFHISPAISGFLLNTFCYLLGFKLLGKEFITYSVISSATFSISYRFFEQYDLLWPNLYQTPLLASILGALFVGIGCGLCVRIGGAPSGDDALAMCVAHVTKIKIQRIYLTFDLIVLGFSTIYIPWNRLIYSLITVALSGQIIGFIRDYSYQPKTW